jgi:hypothetical protein
VFNAHFNNISVMSSTQKQKENYATNIAEKQNRRTKDRIKNQQHLLYLQNYVFGCYFHYYLNVDGGRRGRDRMVVGFITTYTFYAYHPEICPTWHAGQWSPVSTRYTSTLS